MVEGAEGSWGWRPCFRSKTGARPYASHLFRQFLYLQVSSNLTQARERTASPVIVAAALNYLSLCPWIQPTVYVCDSRSISIVRTSKAHYVSCRSVSSDLVEWKSIGGVTLRSLTKHSRCQSGEFDEKRLGDLWGRQGHGYFRIWKSPNEVSRSGNSLVGVACRTCVSVSLQNALSRNMWAAELPFRHHKVTNQRTSMLLNALTSSWSSDTDYVTRLPLDHPTRLFRLQESVLAVLASCSKPALITSTSSPSLKGPGMATFRSLPNEIIYEILGFVAPEDFESFVQISRNVFNLSQPLLKTHREKIRKYGVFPNDYCYETWLFLEDMRLDSTSIRYVTKIDSYEDLLFHRLLPIFPNVTEMSLKPYCSYRVTIPAAIEKITNVGNTKFPKLTNLHLISYFNHCHSLWAIQLYSTWPTVRSLSVEKPSCLEIGLDDRDSPRSTNVTHLQLLNSFIDTRIIASFLSGFQNLQSFVYSCMIYDLFDSTEVNPHRIIRSLRSAMDTLQSLTLLMPDSEDICYMGSMRDFHVLRDLHTEWNFIRPRQGLPASLETLKIHDSMGRSDEKFQEMIRGITESKHKDMPVLEKLAFETKLDALSFPTFDGKAWLQAMQERCDRVGIVLTIAMEGPNDSLWKYRS